MRRLVIIIALLILLPLAEIGVLIAVGSKIGVPWTIALVLLTSALGGWLLRREGSRAWRVFQSDLTERRPPGRSATDGLLVLIGGIFMLVPGFVSDLIGLFFILPPTRAVARRFVQNLAAKRMSAQASTTLFGPRQVRVRAGKPTPTTPPRGPEMPRSTTPIEGPPIEGEIIDPK